MSISQSELDSFHQFALEALGRSGHEVSLEDLVRQWHAQQEHEATLASVSRGVQDADAGRTRDVVDVDTAIRTELGFPARGR
jgi:hypothetical protein